MSKRFYTALFIILAGTTHLAWADETKKAKDLPTVGLTEVIVQFNDKPSAVAKKALKDLGINLNKELDALNTIVMTLPASLIETLSNDPSVLYISPNRALKPKLDYTAATVGGSAAFASNWTGAGVGIAIIDSGIALHPDLGSRVVYSESFTGDGLPAFDYFGHGTHVAGIAAGSGAASSGSFLGVAYTRTFRGIAPKANLINLKVLDGTGAGNVAGVLAALARAIDLKKTYNIGVINMSLGHPVFESYKLDPLCNAVQKAWQAGIVVVIAAGNDGRNNSFGNDGYGTINSPGNSPYAITVGAMKTMSSSSRNDDLIASYSSKGPTAIDHIVKPDIVAPGNRMVSLRAMSTWFSDTYAANGVPLSYYSTATTNMNSLSYFKLSGTSMAAPVVSGAAALLLQKTPGLTPDQVKVRLMKTASKAFPATSVATDPVTGVTYTSQYDIFTIGAGYLDITAALASTDSPKGSAISPTATVNSKTNKIEVTFAKTALWGDTTKYPLSSVWGDMVIMKGSTALWGDSAVWGVSTTSAYSAIWGGSSYWSTTALWGDAIANGSLTSLAGGGIFSPESIKVAVYGEQ